MEVIFVDLFKVLFFKISFFILLQRANNFYLLFCLTLDKETRNS